MSPIHMPFMAPLYPGAHLRGYADDRVIKVTGQMPGGNIAHLQRGLRVMQEWCIGAGHGQGGTRPHHVEEDSKQSGCPSAGWSWKQ
jgi:hypothetical protein